MTTASAGGAAKRTLDVCVGFALLLLSLPVLGLCALLVRILSTGSAIYRQTRVGLGGRPFVMFKLRTMHVDAERRLAQMLEASPAMRDEWRRFRRLEQDPRLVPVLGRWLRRLSLDELPQLFNVLRGDMSLVGPRPLEPDWEAQLPAEVRATRTSVRPGITGMWQVSGRSELDLNELGRIDVDYVHSRSMLTDLVILCRTPRAVMSGRGAF